MECGVPMLNCLLQHTLRSLCSSSDSSDSPNKWVYSVFWRILPRNFPPPKWDYGGTVLDRCKGNKRNWMLVWEDGFCDFYECEKAGSGYMKGRFGAEVFFKMSHEVYNYGEGLVGKVAADNSHKWVFSETPNENDPNSVSSWNVTIEPQPRAWECQFNSGIQTIAVISVREGIIQLGSFDKIPEDLNLVINVQRKFSYLQSIPGFLAVQRPYLPTQVQHQQQYVLKPETEETVLSLDAKRQVIGVKRLLNEQVVHDSTPPVKSSNLGWNSPKNDIPTGPTMLPTISCNFGTLLSKLPTITPFCNNNGALDADVIDNGNSNSISQRDSVKVDDIKVESLYYLDDAQEAKPVTKNLCLKVIR